MTDAHPAPPAPRRHATAEARLRLLGTDLPSHRLEERRVPGHRIFLAVPRGPAPGSGWPVLYMLDGNAAFDHLTEPLLGRVPGLALVGVGYDTDRQFAREARNRDYTPPTAPGAGLRADPHHPGRVAGGAEAFLARLTGPLRAAAEDGWPADPARRMLWGHSFGGLFTLWALLTAPECFARFAAISPSVWWDEPLVAGLVARFHCPLPRPLLMAVGDREKRTGSDGPPPDGPPAATMALAARLARDPMLSLQVEVLAGMQHGPMLGASLPLSLDFAAGCSSI